MSASATSNAIDLARIDGSGGVVWSVSPEGFHTNLVVLGAAASIPTHRNDALDVLVVVLDGSGTAVVDGAPTALGPANALLIRRGTTRSIVAGDRGIRYLTVHAQRASLTIGPAHA